MRLRSERVIRGLVRQLGRRRACADIAIPESVAWRWDRYLVAALYASHEVVRVPEAMLPMVYDVVGPLATLTRTMVNGDTQRTIAIDRDYFSPAGDDVLRMPYFMHPSLYESGLWKRVMSFRDEPKRVRLLFAGTERGYTPNQFTQYTRSDILTTIRERFSEHMMASDCTIALITTDETTDTVTKHAVQGSDYLRLLASSWAFLAAPGYQMPHAHNIIEAMSVGAIPLTSYGQYLDPPLQDGVNCFTFSDAPSLVRAVETLLTCGEERLRRMRASVLHYYDTVLRPEAFASKIRVHSGPLQIVVNAEGESLSLLRRKTRAARTLIGARVLEAGSASVQAEAALLRMVRQPGLR